MANDPFSVYLTEINKAYLRGDATEHTHRPTLKVLIQSLGKKITATNEPKRIECGAPDYSVSRRLRRLDMTIGYIEAKDIGTNLTKEAKNEQIKRYLVGAPNFVLTDYITFRWYVDGELRLTARLAKERKGGEFGATEQSISDVQELLGLFLQQGPVKIKGPKELAEKMSGMARWLRDVIEKTFKQEGVEGSLHGQFDAFREVLLHDLEPEQFADMYAQTIAYGLFTARCYINEITIYGKDKYAVFHGIDKVPKEFTRASAAYLLPKTNPFLRKMFGYIAGPELDDRIAWLVDDLVALLRETEMGSVLRGFGKRTGRRDPVFHFYETFLAQYNPEQRERMGIYYTPQPVVSYIVRSVDWILKEKFGLKRGLADESKIEIKTKKNGKAKKVHKCLILDPALGTGTFLYEVVNQIHKKLRRQKGMWSGYVKEHLLPRIFGFEIQMAPYAVAHTKLGLELADTGYDFASDERVGIYLTNTLEEAEETSRTLLAQWLSDEARAANKVKRDLPIMVVLGNPPYSYDSSNTGPWISDLVREYYKVDGSPLGEKNPKGLQDDYVKFIRFGQHRIAQTGAGILAFITNNGFLDNSTFRGMRQQLMKTFNEIYLLDLHGNSKKKEVCPDGSKDVNVFDIRQGVSIGIFVKEQENSGPCRIYHADLWGLRSVKYDSLIRNTIEDTGWTEVNPRKPYYMFKPQEIKLIKKYEKGWKISEIVPINSSCMNTARDGLVIDVNRERLEKRIQLLAESSEEAVELAERLKIKDTGSWEFTYALEKLRRTQTWRDQIIPCLYRPFDQRWLFHHDGFIDRPRKKVNYHMMRGNLAIATTRQTKENFAALATNLICGQHKIAAVYDRSYFFPLYLYSQPKDAKGRQIEFLERSRWNSTKQGRVPNLSPEFVEELEGLIKLKFVSDGVGDLKGTFGPEDVFDYIYGVFYSPEYRKRYAEFLKIDFPRVPMPKGREIFQKLCKVGEELCKLHLMEAEILEDESKWPAFDMKGDDTVEKGYPKYIAHADAPKEAKVYINKVQYFKGVQPEVWDFHVGGYQVCEKWLKDRRGRKLSFDDISHYQKVVVALGETIRLMKDPCLTEMFRK